MKDYYVYILASKARGTLYIGVTSDLYKRIDEHKQGVMSGFTKKYSVKRLAYHEMFQEIEFAIAREKQLKNWHRQWKINQIESVNPLWNDLSLTPHGS